MKKKIIKPIPFGPIGIIWSAFDGTPKIARVLLSTPGLSAEERASKFYPDSQEASCAEIEAAATAIKSFLEGEDIVFSLDIADLRLCSTFQQSVLRAEHQIPRGTVSTYRLIAAHLGIKNSARAVGNALAKNPFPLIVPCHRAIRSDRYLGGFQGGLSMKRALLTKEGVVFDKTGRVVCTWLHYQEEVSNPRPAERGSR